MCRQQSWEAGRRLTIKTNNWNTFSPTKCSPSYFPFLEENTRRLAIIDFRYILYFFLWRSGSILLCRSTDRYPLTRMKEQNNNKKSFSRALFLFRTFHWEIAILCLRKYPVTLFAIEGAYPSDSAVIRVPSCNFGKRIEKWRLQLFPQMKLKRLDDFCEWQRVRQVIEVKSLQCGIIHFLS